MKHDDIQHRTLADSRARARLLDGDSYPRYLWHSMRESRIYRRLKTIWIGFRRYRLISRIITAVATVLTFMGTGAAFVLFALFCLLLLPPFLLTVGGTMILGLFGRKQQTAQLAPLLTGRTVYLFFPGEIHDPSYSTSTMREFAARPNSIVFVISPYAWSNRGVGGNGFYINARREGEQLYLLRRHYFFFFRRMLSHADCKRVVVVL